MLGFYSYNIPSTRESEFGVSNVYVTWLGGPVAIKGIFMV